MTSDDRNDQPAVAEIRRLLATTAGGPNLRQNLKRHYEHLEGLAQSLRQLGMDGQEIDENIMQVFREYEREILEYVQNAEHAQ
jgi:hypothetical protein